MSAPHARRAPRCRATIGLVPIESVEAASRRRSSSGCSPANAPNPLTPVDSTAACSRPTIPSAVASETPAAAYVRLSLTAPLYEVDRASGEQLAVQLRPPLRAAGDEADDGVADHHAGAVALGFEQLREHARLRLGIVREQLQLGQLKDLARLQQLVEPLARRMDLQPVAGVRGDERPPPSVRLHAQLLVDGAIDDLGELVLVEREPEMVDARQVPLAGLHDDVDCAPLQLGQPELEAHPIELLPRHPRLEGLVFLADAAVPRDEVERQLAEVPLLDLPDARGDEVVVKELHERRILGGGGEASRATQLVPCRHLLEWVRADRLDARPAPARPRGAPGRRLRDAGTDAAAARDADARLADRAVRGRARAASARVRVADRGDRRAGALQLPHAPACPDRRPRPALPARRPERADAASAPGAAPRRAAAGAGEPARRPPGLGREPLPLARSLPL